TYHFAFGRGQPLPFFRGAQSKVLIAFQKGRRLQRLFDEHMANDPNSPYDWASFSKAAKKIRKDGYCLTHDELNLGLTGIAAPILQADLDEVVGSLSAVGSSQSFKLLRQDTVVEMVMDTTRRIAENMRNPPSGITP
ncbi:IclR family transcriptional regulator, partial [Pseudomonas gessardii]